MSLWFTPVCQLHVDLQVRWALLGVFSAGIMSAHCAVSRLGRREYLKLLKLVYLVSLWKQRTFPKLSFDQLHPLCVYSLTLLFPNRLPTLKVQWYIFSKVQPVTGLWSPNIDRRTGSNSPVMKTMREKFHFSLLCSRCLVAIVIAFAEYIFAVNCLFHIPIVGWIS